MKCVLLRLLAGSFLIPSLAFAQTGAAELDSCPEFGGGGLLLTANGKNLDATTLSACRPAGLSAASAAR